MTLTVPGALTAFKCTECAVEMVVALELAERPFGADGNVTVTSHWPRCGACGAKTEPTGRAWQPRAGRVERDGKRTEVSRNAREGAAETSKEIT